MTIKEFKIQESLPGTRLDVFADDVCLAIHGAIQAMRDEQKADVLKRIQARLELMVRLLKDFEAR